LYYRSRLILMAVHLTSRATSLKMRHNYSPLKQQ
jgi:hypothetical protein